jgi:putative peptide zinc metalloprotease protein
LEYYRFREREHAVLALLDGRHSLAEILAKLDQRFGPNSAALGELQAFIGGVIRSGLTVSDGAGQGDWLVRRNLRRLRSGRISAFSNVLAIRFRGIDPDWLLDRLYPYCRFLFGRAALAASLALMLAALVLVATQWTELQSRLPDLQTFISIRNMIWLAVVIACAKVLHELGHALACKHVGGECHELGLMLLVFTPCLYCDVSDSWMQPSRWRRIMVTAAGIWVELILASVCTLLWWFSYPGTLNSIFLNVMLVCAAGTLLINGNPLLRYDGYYVLSDLVDIPNLWQESRAAVRQFVSFCLLGLRNSCDFLTWRGVWLLSYGLLSVVYRLIVLIAILYFVHQLLEPIGFGLVSKLIAMTTASTLLLGLISHVRQQLLEPEFISRIRVLPTLFSVTVLGLLTWVVFAVPFPCAVRSPFVLEPAAAQVIYVTVEGALNKCLAVGDRVKPDSVVAQLENPILRREIDDLKGKIELQRVRLHGLEVRRGDNMEAGRLIPSARRYLVDLQEMVDQKRRQLEALTVRAGHAGVILPTTSVPEPSSDSDRLHGWHGHPLEPRNLGCWLDRMTPLCLVGDGSVYEAVIYVEDADIDLVREGSPVRLRLDSVPGQTFEGIVTEIADDMADELPAHLVAGRDVAFRQTEDGSARPIRSAYQVRASLQARDWHLPIDARGIAKIDVEQKTLLDRCRRLIRRSFLTP